MLVNKVLDGPTRKSFPNQRGQRLGEEKRKQVQGARNYTLLLKTPPLLVALLAAPLNRKRKAAASCSEDNPLPYDSMHGLMKGGIW